MPTAKKAVAPTPVPVSKVALLSSSVVAHLRTVLTTLGAVAAAVTALVPQTPLSGSARAEVLGLAAALVALDGLASKLLPYLTARRSS